MHAGHGYTRTTIEHHDDGSHTITHEHEDGKSHKKHAVTDLDGIHDSMENHLHPDQRMEKTEEEIHPGIHKLAAKMGGDEEKAEEKIHPGLHKEAAEDMDEDQDNG